MMPATDVPDSSLAAFAEAARHALRRGTPAALASKAVQAHVVILPAALAGDFHDYCLRNPQACPLLAVSAPGQVLLPTLGNDLDIRCDLPPYRIWRDGEAEAVSVDIGSIWRDDLVTFFIANGFSSELRLSAPARGRAATGAAAPAPVYATRLPTTPVGRFGGPLLVSMRPLRSDRVVQAIEVSTRRNEMCGVPVHLGDPSLIGITDLSTPECGEARHPGPDELAVFWASGLTALAAARRARPSLCITNALGAPRVIDRPHRHIPPQAGALRSRGVLPRASRAAGS